MSLYLTTDELSARTKKENNMHTTPQKSLTTKKMIAQFYMDMGKYLLLMILAYGLFDASTQGTIARLALILTALAGLLGSVVKAQCVMDRIDEEEKGPDHGTPRYPHEERS